MFKLTDSLGGIPCPVANPQHRRGGEFDAVLPVAVWRGFLWQAAQFVDFYECACGSQVTRTTRIADAIQRWPLASAQAFLPPSRVRP